METPLGVNVLHDALNLGHPADDPGCNFFGMRQLFGIGNQHHHDLMTVVAAPDHDRSNAAAASSFIIGTNVVFPQQITDDQNRLINFRILNIEILNRYQIMAAPLIKTGLQLALTDSLFSMNCQFQYC